MGRTAVVLVSCALQFVKADIEVDPEESPGAYLSLSNAGLLHSLSIIVTVFSVSVRENVLLISAAYCFFLLVNTGFLCCVCTFVYTVQTELLHDSTFNSFSTHSPVQAV